MTTTNKKNKNQTEEEIFIELWMGEQAYRGVLRVVQ